MLRPLPQPLKTSLDDDPVGRSDHRIPYEGSEIDAWVTYRRSVAKPWYDRMRVVPSGAHPRSNPLAGDVPQSRQVHP